jgi:hypothetical protein
MAWDIMNKILSNFFVVVLLLGSGLTQAQLLPDNKNLNSQSVARWMQSNRAIAPIVQVVEPLTADKNFENLSAMQQDEKINALLTSNNLLESADQITQIHGWKSVGEYIRFSNKLGNAIAAYFLFGDMGQITPEQEKQLKEKADPAIAAVPKSDIEFIRKNEKALQKYIQAYGAGR